MSQLVDVAIAAETAYSTRATAFTLCFSVVRVPRSLRDATIFLVGFANVRTVRYFWITILLRAFQIANSPSIIILCWHILTQYLSTLYEGYYIISKINLAILLNFFSLPIIITF